ncbi:FAD-dependent monooxygenase [Algicola sagamiensis]|uniref:FAD-dependent monooxygenase n=1 Tax=Algicola sagamiensis TaxID=163869 RepID=UPI00035D3103|nr:FAD-dependent monooxygenase [Algicola sagamiensis]
MFSQEVTILGGGCIGLALAIGLAKQGVKIALVDGAPEPVKPVEVPDLRVSAINKTSEQLLRRLGIWENIEEKKKTPYQKMHVWEGDSFASINFDAPSLMLGELGHIIENRALQFALFQALKAYPQVSIKYDTQCKDIQQSDREVLLTLESGQPIVSQWVFAADGANSFTRRHLHLPMTYWDYDHHAIVATIRMEEPHGNCARQVFWGDGPLAFLPLDDPHLCSIVWSTLPDKAKQLMELSEEGFNRALYVASGSSLGELKLEGERSQFPLKMRYARQWLSNRVVLLGDAAHTIHPLAGLGMNAGLLDVAALCRIIEKSGIENLQWRHLRQYERQQKAQAQELILIMEGFKRLFADDVFPKKVLRGIGLFSVNQFPALKNIFARHAVGQQANPFNSL